MPHFNIAACAVTGVVLTGCITPNPAKVEVPDQAPHYTQVVSDTAPMVQLNNCNSLVPIRAATTAAGLAEQQAWISQNYFGAVTLRQSVMACGRTPVDRITFRQNSTDYIVFFDISNFYGQVDNQDLDQLLDG